MKKIKIKSNQSGFGLIQVVIAASLMSVLSLGIAGLITNQAQQISYMEDRMSHQNLKAEIEKLVASNIENCTESVKDVKLPTGNKEVNIKLKNKDGDVVFDPANKNKNTLDKVKIDRVFVRDVDVHSGGTGSGEVEIVVNPVRLRKGGGPTDMAPVIIKKNVAMNTATNQLTSCEGSSSTDDVACVYQDFKNRKNSTFKTVSGQYNGGVTIGSFTIPKDTVAFQYDDMTIYPGVTKLGSRVAPVGGTFRVRITGTSRYDHETQSGNQYWKTGNNYAWSYGGIDIKQYTYATNKSGKSNVTKTVKPYTAIRFDTLPAMCARVNTRFLANTVPDNLEVKLFKSTPD